MRRPRNPAVTVPGAIAIVLALACKSGLHDRCVCADDCRGGLICGVAGAALEGDQCAAPEEEGRCVRHDELGEERTGESDVSPDPPEGPKRDLGTDRPGEPEPEPEPTSGGEATDGEPTSGEPTSGEPTSGEPTSGEPTSGEPTGGSGSGEDTSGGSDGGTDGGSTSVTSTGGDGTTGDDTGAPAERDRPA